MTQAGVPEPRPRTPYAAAGFVTVVILAVGLAVAVAASPVTLAWFYHDQPWGLHAIVQRGGVLAGPASAALLRLALRMAKEPEPRRRGLAAGTLREEIARQGPASSRGRRARLALIPLLSDRSRYPDDDEAVTPVRVCDLGLPDPVGWRVVPPDARDRLCDAYRAQLEREAR